MIFNFNLLKIRVLAMEESETLIKDISKFVKKSEINLINIKSNVRSFLVDKNLEFFESKDPVKQVKRVNQIKDGYDLCLVSSWSAARIAYLADLNYIIFFVGHDIRIPPFIKNSKPSYFKKPVNKLNFFERIFYKKVLYAAIACVTGSEELYDCLKKYRKDAIRIDRVIVDTNTFKPNVKPLDVPKNKFTFFCPQRIGIEKGTDILFMHLKKLGKIQSFQKIENMLRRTLKIIQMNSNCWL